MKSFLLNILIIGLSLICLFAVLEIGKGLQAPFNVAGEWIISGVVADSIDAGCISFSFHSEKSKIIIEQSGIYLTIYFGNLSGDQMEGMMENNKLFFSANFTVKKALNKFCRDNIKLKLSLNLIKHPNRQQELAGTLINRSCNECKEIQFSAFRINKGVKRNR